MRVPWSASRGRVGVWDSASAPGSAATTTETAWYADICSTVIVANRQYEMCCSVVASGSATNTTSSHQIVVRLGSGTGGTALAQGGQPAGTTGSVTLSAYGTFIGGTDVAAGTQTFTITGRAATGNLTGATPSNLANRPKLMIKDLGPV